jgi:hypothetical protein
MGSQQSSSIDSTLAATSMNTYNQNSRHRSCSKSRTTCCSLSKVPQQSNSNLTNSCHSRFQLYLILQINF